MNVDLNFNYLTENDIKQKAKDLGVELNILDLGNDSYCFFPGWTFARTGQSTQVILSGKALYGEAYAEGTDVIALITNIEKQALALALENSSNINSELCIYLLYRLFFNWKISNCIFNNREYLWEIRTGEEAIACPKKLRYLEYGIKVPSVLFKHRTKIKKFKLVVSNEIADKIQHFIVPPKSFRQRVALKTKRTVSMDIHPEDKQILEDEVKKIYFGLAQKEAKKNYQGFAYSFNGRVVHIFYKQGEKILVTSFDAPDLCCEEASLTKWVYPIDMPLTEQEKVKLYLDLDEYNKTHSEKISTFKQLTREDILRRETSGN